MHSMFAKLFLSFWVATVLSGVVFFLLAFNLRLAPMHEEHRHRLERDRAEFMSQVLTLYGASAAAAFERDGRIPAMRQDKGPQGKALQAFLFAADGHELTVGAPPKVREAVRRSTAVTPGPVPPGEVVVVPVQGPSGTGYLAATHTWIGPPGTPGGHPKRLPFPLPPDFWLHMVITFVVSGAVCYGLSWILTVPVRRLRSATQDLSAGNLATRVAVPARGRGDELTDLGRDFNQMAVRLEKLVNAHKQLVRDVSHELRSPLARMNVALEIARQQSPPSAEPALQRIGSEGERLNQLIGELLALSRLDGGTAEEKSEVDLTELTEEVVRDADFEACASNRRVRLTAVAGLVLPGNRELLRRALENVVRNAVRYTAPESTVEVTVERAGSSQAVVRVRDFGPGVPEDQLADIFRPFYRVAEARDRQSGGTGIGLAISERTVALHGGSIVARNLPGAGLEVEIRLPLPAGY